MIGTHKVTKDISINLLIINYLYHFIAKFLIHFKTASNTEEKNEYVKILRSQLSNAELYILFFNVISRFGKKWIDSDYINKYQLIQNLPPKYCDGYNPKDYFSEIRFESEELCLSPFKENIVAR